MVSRSVHNWKSMKQSRSKCLNVSPILVFRFVYECVHLLPSPTQCPLVLMTHRLLATVSTTLRREGAFPQVIVLTEAGAGIKRGGMNDWIKKKDGSFTDPNTHTEKCTQTHTLTPLSLLPFIPEQPFKRLGTCAVVFCLSFLF